MRQLTDPTGEVTLTQSYAPYGDTISSVGTGTSAYQFTGEMRDPSGLTYLRARYLDSSVGRFISRDTWGGDYNRPLSLNRWNYVEGNPVNSADPTGLCADPGAINYDGMPNNMRECIYRGVYTGQVQTNYGYPLLDTPSTYDGPYVENTGTPLDWILLLADLCHEYFYQTTLPAQSSQSYLQADINYEIHSTRFESFTNFISFTITNNTNDVFSLLGVNIKAETIIDISIPDPYRFVPVHGSITIKPDQMLNIPGQLKVYGESGQISFNLRSKRSTVRLSANYP